MKNTLAYFIIGPFSVYYKFMMLYRTGPWWEKALNPFFALRLIGNENNISSTKTNAHLCFTIFRKYCMLIMG
jgi:hypothetical protein